MLDVLTIGDAMMTLNPTSYGPLRQVSSFKRGLGGSELNVAIGCSRLGLRTSFISSVGKDEFGRYIFNSLRGEGIDTSQIDFIDGYNTSLNFKEILEDGDGRTFYYRDNSPTEMLTIERIDEEAIKKAKIVHLSGVFLSLNIEKNRRLMKHIIRVAKENNTLITFDPNIRLKLWSKQEAKKYILEILPFVDILLSGIEEINILFETTNKAKIIEHTKALGIKYLIIKEGELGSYGFYNDELIHAPAVKVNKVVDTVGAGDGFNCGFIYGLLNNWDLKRSLEFANTIGSMVVSVSGDNEGLPYLEDVLIKLGKIEKIER